MAEDIATTTTLVHGVISSHTSINGAVGMFYDGNGCYTGDHDNPNQL